MSAKPERLPAEPLPAPAPAPAPAAALATPGGDAVTGFIAAHAILRQRAGAEAYASWLEPLALAGIDGTTAHLLLPSRFMADWARSHHAGIIRDTLAETMPGITAIRIDVGTPGTRPTASPAPDGFPVSAASTAGPAAAPAAALAARDAGSSLAFPATPSPAPSLDPRYSFDRFVTGKSNELAFNAAQTLAAAVGDRPTPGFNPLFLHGPTGLGKTHLMHAIGQAVLARLPQARIAYLSAERFMVEFLEALRARDTIRFKQRLRACDLLMIDDVQFIAGKDSTQEEFFHTMNEIIGAGKWLVISADRSPQNLEGIEARIQSRLAWGLVADINPADYELRLNILKAKLAAQPGAPDGGVRVPDEVVDFLARKIVANVRELEGALNRVIAYANLTGRTVDADFAREVLADALRAHSRKLTIDDIQRRVAEHYALRINDLISPRRARNVARPRQVAMYLAKQLTPRSYPEIGRRFGGRDHTTVMHAVKRIEELRATDHELDRDIAQLQRALDG
jgi:chromosomal replication initiator protein